MAGRIPRQFIDELMLRSDIVEVIDARVPLKKAGKDYKACCPFHQEKTPSFTVSADKQFYHCFGCGQHGTVIGFLMEFDRMSFPEAVEELARRAGMEIPKEAGVFEPEPSTDLLDVLREASRFYRAQLREHAPAIDYLKQRGITGEVARDFELGYAPESWDSLVRALGKDAPAREALVRAGLAVKKDGGGYYDRFRARVMFPIYDHRGRIVGFGGRIIDKGEPKYLNSPETPLFHKGRELYGLYRARDAIRRAGRVMVVEGYMDVVAVAQSGIEYVVATLGTATTRDHLERLFRHASEVVFCFDGDRAGREAAWRALETTLDVLRDGLQASFLFLPDGEDPDTLVRKEGKEIFEARLGKATPLADFLFQSVSAKVDLSRLDGRARLVELAKPLLSKLQPGVLRQMMLEKLGELAQLGAEKLGTVINKTPPPETPSPQRRFSKDVPGPKEPPSLMRRAIALLLQNPVLASRVPTDMGGALSELAGVEVFEAVLKVVATRADLKTGAILESFRGTEYETVVEKLAFLADPVADRAVEPEFDDLLLKLGEEARHLKVESLRQKQNPTPEEKAELARLLSKKGKSGNYLHDH
jgi:DNA primase